MGDSEASMAESAAEYTQAAYMSSGYGETGSDGAYTYGAEADLSAQVPGAEAGAVAGDSSLAASQPAAGYGASVNGDVGAGAGSNASVENGVAESASGAADADKSEMSPEEDRLWSIVKTNSDFDAWTALIEETEKIAGEKLWKIRKVYDTFLAEFPLCYGYWKKYADHEACLGSMDKVVEVYERAVLGVTYSVDIWLHYCTFCISTYGDPETVRRLFERALAYVGTDYLSCPLWDKYIEYEEMHSEWSRVAMIYTRILEIPNRRLDDYLIRFKALAASRPLSELRAAEEVSAVQPAPSQPAGQDNEGETHPEEPEQALRPGSVGLTEAEELEKYIAVREEIYKKAKEFDYKISDFENAIRRPYFHVRPLNNAELENWHNYLDFMEREGDINKVVKLYERCLIACANYPDYWIRYVSCMEAFQSMDQVNNALDRATQVFVKRQPDVHLFAARFREKSGDITGARAAYQLIHTQITPGLLDAIVKHANMEHRVGNSKDAFSLYEQAIAIEKGKENSQALQILYAQFSRFLLLVCGNHEKAREILSEAIENVQLSKPLLEVLIHFESIQSLQKRTDYIDSLVEKFINPSSDNIHVASAAEREELSYIFLEFLDMFGDAQSIVKAEDRHVKLFMPHRSKSDIKKRQAEDYLSSDKAKLAKSYSEGNAPLVGAYATAQNQWPAGYDMQPQAWPPATQAPAQPWNATAYGQQAAYGSYGGYTSGYTAPQVTAPAPQAAGYSGYPSTCPAQAAPSQQSYAQPAATAAALAPVQQPAAVPQPYYGGYY